MHGMLVDTGAAKAIMGTDTMKEYITDILSKYGKVISVSPSESRFTGIGGRQEKSKGLAQTPLGIPLPGVAEVSIDLDLPGDLGSQRPGLLPLSVMLRLQSSILCGVLQGGDGIMILRILDNDIHSRAKKIPKTFFVQLYLTDSCHYLLPIGRFEKGSWAEQSKLRKAVMQYFNEVLRTSAGHQAHQG